MRNSQRDGSLLLGRNRRSSGTSPFSIRNLHTGTGPGAAPFTFPIQVLTELCGRSNQPSTSYAMTYFALWGPLGICRGGES